MASVLSAIHDIGPTWYVLGGAAAFLCVLAWNIRLEIRLRRLLSGKNGASLEGAIAGLQSGHTSMEHFREEVEKYLETVERRLRRSVQGIGTIRFNPFKGMGVGGNQSFSTAFLNEDGTGVVISTLYARDRTSFFSKPVERYKSEHELTEEEQASIAKARESIGRTR